MSSSKISVLPLALAERIVLVPYLPLGMLTAYARVYKDGLLEHRCDIGRVRPGGPLRFPMAGVYRDVREAEAPVCLLSLYLWNRDFNLEAAKGIKEANPDAVIVVGGPEVPRRMSETEAFLDAHPAIDMCVLGEGEATCAEMLETLAESGSRDLSCLKDVPGLVYRARGELVRTPPRQRLKDLSVIPSPYLTGEFEPWIRHVKSTILETNRGCPYGCVYCDWGAATLQKIAPFSLERVVREVDYLASVETNSVFIADANFGVLPQDVEIARAFVKAKERTGHPKAVVVNFAKNGGPHLMETIKTLHHGGLMSFGIIAMQSTDPDVLTTIRRSNIKTSSYEKMMRFFNAEGVPMASDILIGLPGQTVDSLQGDLQFCFDWKVAANCFNTSMMPNAPMSDPKYIEEHGIVVGPDRIVRSTKTFTNEDLMYMRALNFAYMFHVRFGVGRYFLYYLQNDHGVPAVRFVRRWLDGVLADDPDLPLSARAYREIIAPEKRHHHVFLLNWQEEADFFFEDLAPFYRELRRLAERDFGVAFEPGAVEAVATANAAVMPLPSRQYPLEVELEHDVASYFAQFRSTPSLRVAEEPFEPLASFGPGTLRVGDEDTEVKSLAYTVLYAHGDPGWELPSAVRF